MNWMCADQIICFQSAFIGGHGDVQNRPPRFRCFWQEARHDLRVSHQARTPDFWHACDGISGQSYWQQVGAPSDGKGEPGQSNAVRGVRHKFG